MTSKTSAVSDTRRVFRAVLVVLLIMLTTASLSLAGPVQTDSTFIRTWERTDKPVADGQVTRTWMWGPEPVTPTFTETYAEGSLPDGTPGKRLIQYFDKSRMEFSDPTIDPEFVWAVTNGLLATELIAGRLQTGHTTFIESTPAHLPVAGDIEDPEGPTYATFTNLRDKVSNRSGLIINERVNRSGDVSTDTTLDQQNIVVGAYDPITEHNIALPFWDFMNSKGVVYENGEFIEARLFQDPVFATGRPITEPYWADVLVGGMSKLVLMQCFERRCLTYTPTNAPEWQVEAGNVGRHYYAWRHLGSGTAP